MFNYIWPIALVVLSNVIYQVCAKSVPGEMDPFAALTVTYLVAAVSSVVLYCVLGKKMDLLNEYKKLNWAPFVLGIAIVGLEVGFTYAYRAGWKVSMASLVQGIVLAIALFFVGVIFYKEGITWNKIVGVVVCLVGLVFINIK